MESSSEFYSIPEAAKRFGVTRATMWKWVKSNKIKAIVTPGGHHRIVRNEIDSLLTQDGVPVNKSKENPTILIVDDDKAVLNSIKTYLVRQHYTVDTALDGFSAGVILLKHKPDLIILDLMMEGMDGFEVCRTIKSDPTLNRTRVLIMTGYDTPENKARALQEGADAYLPKSVDFELLRGTVEKLLSPSDR